MILSSSVQDCFVKEQHLGKKKHGWQTYSSPLLGQKSVKAPACTSFGVQQSLAPLRLTGKRFWGFLADLNCSSWKLEGVVLLGHLATRASKFLALLHNGKIPPYSLPPSIPSSQRQPLLGSPSLPSFASSRASNSPPRDWLAPFLHYLLPPPVAAAPSNSYSHALFFIHPPRSCFHASSPSPWPFQTWMVHPP